MSLIRSGLSTPSQRNEEAVSGRRIPTLLQFLPLTGADDVVVVVVVVPLLPHAASKSINNPIPNTVLNDLRGRLTNFIVNLSFHFVCAKQYTNVTTMKHTLLENEASGRRQAKSVLSC